MVSHECPNCNRKFVRKADLVYHMEKKKKPCVGIFIDDNNVKDVNGLENIIMTRDFNDQMDINTNNDLDLDLNLDLNLNSESVLDVKLDSNLDLVTLDDSNSITNTFDNFSSKLKLPVGKNDENKCEHCLKCFSTKYNLNKHVKTVCKLAGFKSNVNLETTELSYVEHKDKQVDILIEQNEQLKKMLVEESIEHKKQTEELHKMMINLIKKETSKQNKKKVKINNLNNGTINNSSNTNTNTNTTNTNNGTINNNIIIQFGKEDLSQIDNKHFINLIKSNSTGAKIITDLVKMIHFNEDCPQFQNICMSDLNRGRVVMYDGVKWNTITNGDKIIPDLIEKAVNYSNTKDNQLRERFLQNPRVLGRMDVIKKYTDKCDTEQLEELKEEQYYGEADNKDKIADCEQFIELVENRVKELIYNEKDKVLKKKNDLISKNQIFLNPNIVIT